MSKIQFDFLGKRLYPNGFSSLGRCARRSSGDFIVPFESEWFVRTTKHPGRTRITARRMSLTVGAFHRGKPSICPEGTSAEPGAKAQEQEQPKPVAHGPQEVFRAGEDW
jgi:hypothetical protein